MASTVEPGRARRSAGSAARTVPRSRDPVVDQDDGAPRKSHVWRALVELPAPLDLGLLLRFLLLDVIGAGPDQLRQGRIHDQLGRPSTSAPMPSSCCPGAPILRTISTSSGA